MVVLKIVCPTGILHGNDSLLGNVYVVEKNRTPKLFMAEKFILIILLAETEKGHSWEHSEKESPAERWEQLFYSQQVKKLNCNSSMVILSFI